MEIIPPKAQEIRILLLDKIFTPSQIPLKMTEFVLTSGGKQSGEDFCTGLEYVYFRFERRLRDAGAKYVLVFDLRKEGRHIYSLFFATKDIKGCDVMKRAIWRVDRTGSYTFRGAKPGQIRLAMTFDHSGLRDDLRAEFGSGWVSVEQADEFVQGDRTQFYSGHLRKENLYPLESDGIIEVVRPKGVKGFPRGKGIRFRFLVDPKPQVRQESLGL